MEDLGSWCPSRNWGLFADRDREHWPDSHLDDYDEPLEPNLFQHLTSGDGCGGGCDGFHLCVVRVALVLEDILWSFQQTAVAAPAAGCSGGGGGDDGSCCAGAALALAAAGGGAEAAVAAVSWCQWAEDAAADAAARADGSWLRVGKRPRSQSSWLQLQLLLPWRPGPRQSQPLSAARCHPRSSCWSDSSRHRHLLRVALWRSPLPIMRSSSP
mmetsp:Transcript_74271/g.176944  ORF Transcript_74271/g.176944 Transcript_74271/m.176944 type:complete len:213 (+) Transcript_74271:991-1629(+)